MIPGHQSTIMPCDHCGKPVSVPAYKMRKEKPHYCSIVCRVLGRQKRVTKTCLECNRPFSIPTYRSESALYCSRECKHRHKSELRPCAQCGKIISCKRAKSSQPRVFCSRACQHAYQSIHCRRENHPLWKNAHPRDMGTNWVSMRSAVLKRDYRTCQHCGATSHLDVHHLIPARHFRTPEESNALNNLVTLCDSCHAKADGETRRRLI